MSSTATFILSMYFLSASHAETPVQQNSLTPAVANSPEQAKPIAPLPVQVIQASQPVTAVAQSVLPAIETAKEKEIKAAKLKNDAAIKLADASLAKISKQLAEISYDRKENIQQLKSVNDLLANNAEIVTIPAWIKSPIFRKLFAKQYRLRNEFDAAKISLMPAHPRYKRLKARATALNKEIYNELFKIKLRLQQKGKSTLSQEKNLTKSLTVLKAKLGEAKKDQYKLAALSKMAELSLVKAEKSKIEDRTRMLNNALEEHGQNLLTSAPASSPRLIQLLDQYTDMSMNLAELSTKWSGSHPKIKQIKSHLALLQDQIADLARKDILKMDNMAQSLYDKEEEIIKETEELKLQKEEADMKKKEAALQLKEKKAHMAAQATQMNNTTVSPVKNNSDNLSLAYERKANETVTPDSVSLMDQ